MSNTTKTAEQDPARELEQAEQEVEKVLDRIKDADKKVGPEDLERAERRVKFARARLEGEGRRREEEAERERQRRLEEVKERAESELDPEPLHRLKEQADKALSDYVAACVDYDRKVEETADKLSHLEPLPQGWRAETGSGGRSLTLGEFVARPTRPVSRVSEMAHGALRTHIPRGFIDLENPH